MSASHESPLKREVQEDFDTIWRDRENVRLVMINPTPATGKRCSGLSRRRRERLQLVQKGPKAFRGRCSEVLRRNWRPFRGVAQKISAGNEMRAEALFPRIA